MTSLKNETLFSNYAGSMTSSTGYTFNELKGYSILLVLIVIVGFLCHTIILFLLIYQQYMRFKQKNGNYNVTIEYNNLKSRKYAKTYFFDCNNNKENNSNEVQIRTNRQVNKRSNFKNHRKFKSQIYSNYVTYAFVFHQILVDFIRILYSLLYSNRLYYEYKIQAVFGQKDLVSTPTLLLNTFYEKFCTPMASFYSVLTMVTIVNILTILISETCRFYDLKLNSSDTSNFCCVLFGILLIWISSLIIISSLMLVGVADSAAPTWRCDLGETESTTRSLVINIVWFLLIAFVLVIAFLYSFSLYRELNSMDYEDNNAEFLKANPSLLELNSDLLKRHIKIVEETTKRLFILVCLIIIFLLTFMPNFITTVLKNTINTQEISLIPYSLISSIINLSDSTLNAIILLYLCIKSKDTDFFSIQDKNYDKPAINFKLSFTKTIQRAMNIFKCKNVNEVNDLETGSHGFEDECANLNNIEHLPHKVLTSNNIHKPNNVSRTSLKEFYSKIGNRLGNLES